MKLALIISIAFSIACVSIRLSGKETPVWTSSLTQDSLIEKARAGDPYFQAILGIYTRAGENGINVDFDAARQWSQRAAKADQPLGLYNLGNLALLLGEFEASNTYYQDAQLLLTRRASEGDPIAQFAMGEICFFVTPKNPSRGIEYFKESAVAGYPQAQATLGALYLKGLPPLLQQDTRKGITLLVEGARRQSMTARFNLGMAYYNGEGVPKDKNRAIRWLRLAADQNFAEAQYSLATLLLEVDPVINKHEGIRLLQQAAEQHHIGASEDLRKHLGGRGTITPQTQTPVSPSQPKPSAAQLSLAKNYRLAGQKHYNGQGTKQSFEKAYAYFRKAADLGDSEAQRYLALLLFHGKGCAQNRIEAGQWLRLAASTGDMEAKRLLTTFAHLFK